MKILLIHPITEGGKEYGRGVHDVDEGTAERWLKDAPHAAVLPPGEQPGTVTEAADAPATGKQPAKQQPPVTKRT